jgi:hypothetical protein
VFSTAEPGIGGLTEQRKTGAKGQVVPAVNAGTRSWGCMHGGWFSASRHLSRGCVVCFACQAWPGLCGTSPVVPPPRTASLPCRQPSLAENISQATYVYSEI